eukprot:TRINITY_DN4913_c0_g1_i1.p1 TRINITY_DN4913_c0_g1~~TRINITY_DN4913_c0_g1_i1.p1  ORF type:complete len:1047 (+),score=226.21 TRINITY_DN4913_c0_g1_i1:46-3186(+)
MAFAYGSPPPLAFPVPDSRDAQTTFVALCGAASHFCEKLLVSLSRDAVAQWALSGSLATDAVCAVLPHGAQALGDTDKDIVYANSTELAEDTYGFALATLGGHNSLVSWRYEGVELLGSFVVSVRASLRIASGSGISIDVACRFDVTLGEAGSASCLVVRPHHGPPPLCGSPAPTPSTPPGSTPPSFTGASAVDASAAQRAIGCSFDALRSGSLQRWADHSMSPDVLSAIGPAMRNTSGTEAALRFLLMLRGICGEGLVVWHTESLNVGTAGVVAQVAVAEPRRNALRRLLQIEMGFEAGRVCRLSLSDRGPLDSDALRAPPSTGGCLAVPSFIDDSAFVLQSPGSRRQHLPDPVALGQQYVDTLTRAVEEGTLSRWAETALAEDVSVTTYDSGVETQSLSGRGEFLMHNEAHLAPLGGASIRQTMRTTGYEQTGGRRVRVSTTVGGGRDVNMDITFQAELASKIVLFCHDAAGQVCGDPAQHIQDCFSCIFKSLEKGEFGSWSGQSVTEDIVYISSHPTLGKQLLCGRQELGVHFDELTRKYLSPPMKVRWASEDARKTGPSSARITVITHHLALANTGDDSSLKTRTVHHMTFRGRKVSAWRSCRILQERPPVGVRQDPVTCVRTALDRFYQAVNEGTVKEWIDDCMTDDVQTRSQRMRDAQLQTSTGKAEYLKLYKGWRAKYWSGGDGALLSWRPEYVEATGFDTVRTVTQLTVCIHGEMPEPPRLLVYDIKLRGERICNLNAWTHHIAPTPPIDAVGLGRTIFDRYFRAMHDGTMVQWAEQAMTDDVIDVVHNNGCTEMRSGREEFCRNYNSVVERLGPGAQLTWRPQTFVQTSPNTVRAIVILVMTPACGTETTGRCVYELFLRSGRICRRELWMTRHTNGECGGGGGTGILSTPNPGAAAAVGASVAALILTCAQAPRSRPAPSHSPIPSQSPRSHSPGVASTTPSSRGAASDEPAAGHVAFERPCQHNDWDSMRIKRGWVILRCRACASQWRVGADIWREKRCHAFMSETCAGECGLLHVHRRRLNLEQRNAQVLGDQS